MTSHLKIYFRQMLDWFEQLDTELVCAFLLRWPTLEELQKVPPAQLRTFFRKHRCRDQERIERRLLAIRQAIPAIRDRAVIEAKSTVVKMIVRLIGSLLEGIADLDEKIEEAATAHPDFFIFNSLPGGWSRCGSNDWTLIDFQAKSALRCCPRSHPSESLVVLRQPRSNLPEDV